MCAANPILPFRKKVWNLSLEFEPNSAVSQKNVESIAGPTGVLQRRHDEILNVEYLSRFLRFAAAILLPNEG